MYRLFTLSKTTWPGADDLSFAFGLETGGLARRGSQVPSHTAQPPGSVALPGGKLAPPTKIPIGESKIVRRPPWHSTSNPVVVMNFQVAPSSVLTSMSKPGVPPPPPPPVENPSSVPMLRLG